MARRRKSMKRASTRRRRAFFKAKSRRRSGGNMGGTGIMISAAIYGAGREAASEFINSNLAKITGNLPTQIFGNFADEAVTLAAAWTLWKGKLPFVNVRLPGFLRGKMAKQIGMAGVIIESSRIGSNFSGFIPGGMTGTQTVAPKLAATLG